MAAWPYNTQRWQRLRRLKLRANPLCEYCPGGKLTAADTVDHAQAIADGGAPFEFANLRSCCSPCHGAKTARGPEAGAARTTRPRKGCNSDGSPLDPAHPWAKG